MSPRRRSTTWIRVLPVRPLPSSKGWTVSNWAWTSAACTTGGRASSSIGSAGVVQQRVDHVGRGRDEVRPAGRVVVAADPVLLRAHPAAHAPVRCLRHEAAMDRQDVVPVEAVGCHRVVDGQLHGVDVGQDLAGGRADPASGVGPCLAAGELAHADLQPLDLRRGDGLGAQQETGQWCQARRPRASHASQRALGVGDRGHRAGSTTRQEVPQGFREEDPVPAGTTVPRRGIQRRVGLPRAFVVAARILNPHPAMVQLVTHPEP